MQRGGRGERQDSDALCPFAKAASCSFRLTFPRGALRVLSVQGLPDLHTKLGSSCFPLLPGAVRRLVICQSGEPAPLALHHFTEPRPLISSCHPAGPAVSALMPFAFLYSLTSSASPVRDSSCHLPGLCSERGRDSHSSNCHMIT